MPDNQPDSTGNRSSASCGTDARRSAAELPDKLRCTLTIMRHYFVSFAQPQSNHWQIGIEIAVATFGEERGPGIAWHSLRAVQTMRMARHSVFQFCNPTCQCCAGRLTENEAHLMAALNAIGRGKPGEAHLSSMMLCEGNPDGPLLDALSRLDASLNAVVA